MSDQFDLLVVDIGPTVVYRSVQLLFRVFCIEVFSSGLSAIVEAWFVVTVGYCAYDCLRMSGWYHQYLTPKHICCSVGLLGVYVRFRHKRLCMRLFTAL